MGSASFIIQSLALGAALAMDAFSVCIATGLQYPNAPFKDHARPAAWFGFFQFLMPLAGWGLLRVMTGLFSVLTKVLPVIGAVVLFIIGISMIVKKEDTEEGSEGSSPGTARLLVQSLATSVDALSAGFAMTGYGVFRASLCSTIIGLTTFAICLSAFAFCRRIGHKVTNVAPVIGGSILIIIGIKLIIEAVA